MIDFIKKRIWLFVIGCIEKQYLNNGSYQSSAVVDCCLFVSDEIKRSMEVK